MKKYLLPLCLFVLGAFVIGFWAPISSTLAEIDLPFIEREPDIPSMLQKSKSSMPKEEFLEKRAEAFAIKRGLNNGLAPDPEERQRAVEEMDRQQEALVSRAQSPEQNFLLSNWTPIGPAPIIAGGARHSGRVTAIAVHPTNPDIVYVGTAQGGLYRSTNGGENWTPLMDNAQSLAIGAVAISKSNPEIVYVGTGEPNFSSDSFFGVGVYRIENASTTATLIGPLNKDAANADVFTGRSISEIIVHPTDSNTIFLGTTSGVGGIGGAANNVLPSRGVYRSTNAAGASPTFAKLTGLAANANVSIRDIAIDPANPNILVAGVVAATPTGGIYRTTDALAANPTFAQTLQYTGATSTNELTTEFAAIHPAGNQDATFYAASGNLGGRVLISTDGGASWTQQIDNNFCTPQCFYDIAIDVAPNDVNRVYLGGAPSVIAAFSTTGGTSFTEGGSGVHVDTHALAVSPSNPAIVYLGTDGGIYRSTNSGMSYTHLNTPQFFATQFMSVAVHPTDANFTIGGTQDNGTNFFNPAGDSWTRVDGGDGGYAVIDQNATDTTNVRMYHTYFSQIGASSIVGYATRATTTAAWSFRGCNGTVPNNGINCNDTAVLFYAPLESGPGNPNTIYYGSDRLYRSDNNGTNHTVVSQAPIQNGVPISAIGISPQNDNIRIVGLSNGGLFGTNTGSATLVNFDPSNQVTNGFIARAVIDPNNSAIAYVTVANFGVANVFKTTNLNTDTPSWTNISAGIPQVPVNAFVIDPADSNTLYAGTDIGVYASTNGGASWAPFGAGLPRVAVFDMAITNASPRKLRIATHGKGMYEIVLNVTPSGAVADFDGDGKTDISVFRPNGGNWFAVTSSNSQFVGTQFGANGDVIVPGDYDGDGKTDRAVFRPSNGYWYILRSSDGQFTATQFGVNGDKPAAADFDGDGRTDLAVFRPADGIWYLLRSTAGFTGVQFGNSSDTPVPADFDGDNKADIAVFRATNGSWYRVNSGNNQFVGVQFGANGDIPVVGDYDNDNKADIAVFRPSVGDWFRLNSTNGQFVGLHFGTNGDVPAPGDFDGDGRTDQAVFRPADGTWYLLRSTAGFTAAQFGANGDVPVPARQNP